MNAHEQKTEAASITDKGDNLETINGIGPAWSEALREAGIYRFLDLTQHTPESLAQTLRENAEVSISPKRIASEQWIEQARVLAEGDETEATAESVTEEPMRRQHAGFSLFFDVMTDEHGEQTWQTRVYHDESGDETLIPGIESGEWVNWILQKAELQEPSTTGESAVAADVVARTRVEITRVDLSESEGLVQSDGVAEKWLIAEVHFRLVGPLAESLAAQRTPYEVEVYTAGVPGGDWDLVIFERGRLQPDVFEYTSKQDFPMPEIGRYSVCSTIMLVAPEEIMAFYEGPTINVVA